MIETALALGGAVLAATGAAVLLAPQPAEETHLLRMPTDLSVAQAEAVLGTIAGLPRAARLTHFVEGAAGELRHGVRAGFREVAAVRASLRGVVPGVQLEAYPEPAPEVIPDDLSRLWAGVGWRGTHVLLNQDQREEASAALLGVLHGARNGERVRLEVRLRPVWRRSPPPMPANGRKSRPGSALIRSLEVPVDQVRRIRDRYAGPLLQAQVQVVVWAHRPQRARQLLHQVVAVLRSRTGARGRLVFRTWLEHFPVAPTMLGAAEVVPLLGWPLDGPAVPGLTYFRSPRLLPDRAIPRRGGRCFGTSTWPDLADRGLHQPVEGALSHSLILGPTGSGKSALLTNLLLDDIKAGRGALLLDMKGDTALDVLRRIPEGRERDVVVLDPSDARALPGIKSIGDASSAELAADLWVGLFRSLFADSWGIRTERYLRLGIQTLAARPGAVITELPRLFADAAFRRKLLTRADDPLLSASWARFDALSAPQQAEHLQAPLGKVQDLIGRGVVRRVLGQTEPRMTVTRAIRERKIVIVRLPSALLGDTSAQLLGGLTLYEAYQAVMARLALEPRARVPYGFYIDEPAVMRFVPIPLDSLYELARGLGVGVTTATQSLAQLPDPVERALTTNAATFVSFRTGHQDAARVAREIPEVSAEGVQHLGRFEIVARLGLAHGQVAAPATARTVPLPAPSSDEQAIRSLAASLYGSLQEPTQDDPHGPTAVPPGDDGDPLLGRRRRNS